MRLIRNEREMEQLREEGFARMVRDTKRAYFLLAVLGVCAIVQLWMI